MNPPTEQIQIVGALLKVENQNQDIEETADLLVNDHEATPKQAKQTQIEKTCQESGEKIVLSEKDSDSDSQLPLFQQKKYIAKQKEI